MKRKVSIFALTLLLICILPTALNIPLVQADAGGTGKFLTIEIVGEGYVNATKVQSGEYWEFFDNGTEKVGAGTILLEAVADLGWNFSRWEGDLTSDVNPTEYKTEKYGTVIAVFVKVYTITAIAFGPGTINGETSLTVEVEHGAASPTFEFAPTDPALYDITLIKVDDDYIDYTTSYAFPEVTSDHDIVVTFDDIGIATVPGDINVRSLIDSIASAMFDDTGGGTLIGIALDFPEGTALLLYEIATNATDADGTILLAFQLNEFTPVAVTKGPSADSIFADVDGDYDVDGTDVSLVANAIKSLVPQGEYDADSDVDRNGVLDEEDVKTVNENKGATLTALIEGIDWWTEGGILYIRNANNDWSGFRAH
jgi:hypothetical protein